MMYNLIYNQVWCIAMANGYTEYVECILSLTTTHIQHLAVKGISNHFLITFINYM